MPGTKDGALSRGHGCRALRTSSVVGLLQVFWHRSYLLKRSEGFRIGLVKKGTT